MTVSLHQAVRFSGGSSAAIALRRTLGFGRRQRSSASIGVRRCRETARPLAGRGRAVRLRRDIGLRSSSRRLRRRMAGAKLAVDLVRPAAQPVQHFKEFFLICRLQLGQRRDRDQCVQGCVNRGHLALHCRAALPLLMTLYRTNRPIGSIVLLSRIVTSAKPHDEAGA